MCRPQSFVCDPDLAEAGWLRERGTGVERLPLGPSRVRETRGTETSTTKEKGDGRTPMDGNGGTVHSTIGHDPGPCPVVIGDGKRREDMLTSREVPSLVQSTVIQGSRVVCHSRVIYNQRTNLPTSWIHLYLSYRELDEDI